MRFQTKLLVAVGLLLTLSISAAALAYWGIERSLYTLERSRLASRQLESYLQLSRHVYEAALQSAAHRLDGDDGAAAAPSDRSAADLARARDLIVSEIAFVTGKERAEEEQELDRLQAIEFEIGQLERALHETAAAAATGPARDPGRLSGIIARVGARSPFNQRIEAAIADEAHEVRETDRAAMRFYANLGLAAKLHALLAAALTAGSLALLLRGLRRPLAGLLTGTTALAAGDFTHRIRIAGSDEFSSLAGSFNRMAADLQQKRAALEGAQSRLEEAVAKRTEELRQANRALEAADRARRRFLADISHELRTPLTIVRGEAQVSLRGKSKTSREYRRALRCISEQSARMATLVNDLLFIARHDASEPCLANDRVSLGDVLAHACEDARVMAAPKELDITCRCGAADAVVLGDQARLRQVFLILLDNAICYSRPRGNISAELARTGHRLVATVTDDGIGIRAEELDRVFERYRRGANASRHHADGVGLGLPVAKAIVEAHGGRIAIESALDAGTTVRVSLPGAGGRDHE